MKKILSIMILVLLSSACTKQSEAKADNYICTYGQKDDEAFVKVTINYNKEQYVNSLYFEQIFAYEGENVEDELTAYEKELNQFSGVNARASYEGGKVHHNYSINLNEYATEADVLGVIKKEALQDNGYMDQSILKEVLENNDYSCK